MNRLFRVLFVAATAALLVTAAAVPSDSAPRHRHEYRVSVFDGNWSVAIYTSYGSCGSYRAAIRISGGRVEGGNGDYSVNGRVSPSGAVSVTVSGGAGSASGYGRLSRSSGGGRWRSSGGECAGSWSASRRG
ncbi:MAG: hypothetical protein WBF58_13025 [Xanthobacteraceae bacterium]